MCASQGSLLQRYSATFNDSSKLTSIAVSASIRATLPWGLKLKTEESQTEQTRIKIAKLGESELQCSAVRIHRQVQTGCIPAGPHLKNLRPSQSSNDNSDPTFSTSPTRLYLNYEETGIRDQADGLSSSNHKPQIIVTISIPSQSPPKIAGVTRSLTRI